MPFSEHELKIAAMSAANTACSTARYGYQMGASGPMRAGEVLEEAKRIYAWFSEADKPQVHVTNGTAAGRAVKTTRRAKR